MKLLILISLLTFNSFANPKETLDTLKFQGSIQIDKIEVDVLDAFDDANATTGFERWAWSTGNKLHIKTKKNVVKNLIYFQEGDSVTMEELEASERFLRKQNFISKARVFVYQKDVDGKKVNVARIKTSDMWTTNLPIGVSKGGGNELTYFFGFVEYNFLGYGQQIGYIFYHALDRDMNIFQYRNPNFIWNQNELTANISQNTDGNNYSLGLRKDFTSLKDEWAYEIRASHTEQTHFIFNHPDKNYVLKSNEGPDEVRDLAENFRVVLVEYEDVRVDTLKFGVLKKDGVNFYQKYGGGYEVVQRNHKGSILPERYGIINNVNGTLDTLSYHVDTNPYGRIDYEFYSMPVFRYYFGNSRFKKVKNFRNVKWDEDIEVGWSVSNVYKQNLKAFGATSNDPYFGHSASILEVMNNKHFFNGSAGLGYFIRDGEMYDGRADVKASYLWKKSKMWNTSVYSNFANLINAPDWQYLSLGGLAGMAGFPTGYYNGNTRAWFEIEERFFPPPDIFERGTILPVLAAFVNGGNTFDSYKDVDVDDFYYSVGVGLRLGLTKSTLGVVNHINFSWPLNGRLKGGFSDVRLSIQAKGGL